MGSSSDRYQPQHNLTATISPSAADNSSRGYSLGSVWKVVPLGRVFMLQYEEETSANAVWVVISGLPVPTYANDTAAKAGGVLVGLPYKRTDGLVAWVVS